jgi:hypothetical protein
MFIGMLSSGWDFVSNSAIALSSFPQAGIYREGMPKSLGSRLRGNDVNVRSIEGAGK